MEMIFVIFGAYWIVESFIPEPPTCWREIQTEEGKLGTSVICTEEELKLLKVEK